MVTQREKPKMVLIQPSFEFHDGPGETAYERGGNLIVTIPDGRSVSVPFRKSFDGVPSEKIVVFSPEVDCIDEGDAVATLLSEYLGSSVRLMVKDPRTARKTPESFIPNLSLFSHTPQTAFADGFPFLLLSDATISDINQHLHEKDPSIRPVQVLNFRPNIYVNGLKAYEEETLKVVRIGGHDLFVVGRCTRCQVPSNNLEKGELGLEPLKTLQSYRRVDPGAKYEACVGMWCVQRDTGYQIRVGDVVEIVETTTQHDLRTKTVNPDFWQAVEASA